MKGIIKPDSPAPSGRLGGTSASPLRGGWLVLFLFPLLFFSSCDIDRETEDCWYNTRIIYRYNRENTTTENVLTEYIQSLDEYIFDEQGILVAINHLPGESCFGEYITETNLPEGRYTVITWGNKAAPSKVNKEQPGVTTKEEMMLYLDNPYIAAGNTAAMQNNSERLYYGYRTFSVAKYGVSRVYVDMSHSHCVLNITVRWKKAAEVPANTRDFYMLLKDVPSMYDFMPEFMFRAEGEASLHRPGEDLFPAVSSEQINYIPLVHSPDGLLTHRAGAVMGDRALQGQFVTYRYRNGSHPLLSIHTPASQVMKEIDLHAFFKALNIELDTNRRQEFDLLLLIDGGEVIVSLVTIDDWIDGGYL
ncbi:FimB/Mfa2 family fimbrial subunit [Dysgonomonas reticulitermitis]